jgi:hypothetical protein
MRWWCMLKYNQGWSVSKIAAHLQIPKRTAYDWISKYGGCDKEAMANKVTRILMVVDDRTRKFVPKLREKHNWGPCRIEKYLEFMAEELCPTCKVGKQVSSSARSEGNVAIKETVFSCGHKHVRLTIEENISVGLKLKTKTKEKLESKPVEEVTHVVKPSGYQLRHIIKRNEKGTHVLQIGWENSEIDTVHCKACDNDWKRIGGKNVDNQFELRETEKGILKIKCKKCGAEVTSG